MVVYDYRYYINGRYIDILQRCTDGVYDPYLSLSDELFVTPENADSNAIYLRWTKLPNIPANENSDIDLSEPLAIACVHYIRSKLLSEDDDNPNNAQLAQMEMNKFHTRVQRYMSTRKGRGRKAMPTESAGVLR